MITGINCLRIFSVMITDWETYFTDLQANDFGNLGKNNSGNTLVGNHAVIFTEINSPRFFSVGNVHVENGISLERQICDCVGPCSRGQKITDFSNGFGSGADQQKYVIFLEIR